MSLTLEAANLGVSITPAVENFDLTPAHRRPTEPLTTAAGSSSSRIVKKYLHF